MGSGISGFSPNDIPGQTEEALSMSLQLGYTRSDVNRLYRAFRKMDVSKTGSISLRSYCKVNKISTAFGELIFRRMLQLGNEVDRDLSFKDYLLSSWNALSIFENDSISFLTFQIFDVDDSGMMTVEEVRHMIEVIYRESDQKNLSVLHILLENIGKLDSISIDDFVVLVRNLPILLYPVFDLIKSVRQKTLGEKRWIEISKIRMLPLANKFMFDNKVNSGNISMSQFTTKNKGRNGSFNSVSSQKNRNIRRSFTGREIISVSEGSVNGGNITARSNNRDDESVSLYPKPVRRRNSLTGSEASQSPGRMRPHSFSAVGSAHGSMGMPPSHHNASTSAIAVYNATTSLKRNGLTGSTIHRMTSQGAPREFDIAPSPAGSVGRSGSNASFSESSPKTNLDAIKVANALHLDRMKKVNSENLNKLMEANSTLDAYKKSVHHLDTAQSLSSSSSRDGCETKDSEEKQEDIQEERLRKIEAKNGNKEGGFTSARRYSK